MRATLQTWQPYWKHLRVPFQLSLAPIFLWGGILAKVEDWRRFAFAFVAFHFFLYTGVTAYNSAYDKDTGPVGGMHAPPKVPAGLLTFSLVLQIVGAVIVGLTHPFLLAIYTAFFVLGIAYSHPLIRLKRYPFISAVTVLIGQGVLGFLAGWVGATGRFGPIGAHWSLGIASASLTTLGLYPLTQIYQIEEDKARGDQTLAVTLGETGAIRLSIVCLALAGLSAVSLMLHDKAWLSSFALGTAYLFILAYILRFGRQPHSVDSAFYSVQKLNYVSSTGFIVFIGLRLMGVL